jgi:hypothetical protein
MLIHGAWNAFATVIYSRIFVLETLSNRTLEIVGYAVIALVSATMIAAMPIVARRLRDQQPVPVSATPLPAMQPWLG